MGHDAGRLRVLVPRLLDADNTNAQNLNAKALLARFRRPEVTWVGLHYGRPDPGVAANPRVHLVRLMRRRLWTWHAASRYLSNVDAIFYPGFEWFDARGLVLRGMIRKRVPVIATFEGLAGDAAAEAALERAAGHPVSCHRVEGSVLGRVRAVLGRADHVVAISPFLARMGRVLYGDKFSVLPLGVDAAVFHPAARREGCGAAVVVAAGHVSAHKRPSVFVDLAARYSDLRFRWYGEGAERGELIQLARSRGLANVEFSGAKSPADLAEAFRVADVFVLPSRSEGAPKVIQEAAACGLPVVAFGHFEPPSVVDGGNGFVVWTDQELVARIGQLAQDRGLRQSMCARSLEMAARWSWDVAAPQWEERIVGLARAG